MKNIIVVLALFFAIGINAQTKKATRTETVSTAKLTPEMAATKNVTDLSAFTPLDSKTSALMQNVFISKYDALFNNSNLSAERKSALSESISSQMESVLGKTTFEKVKANTKLYDSLIN